jgi:aryl-alcohol dehydrogenase-like predicted oxidoreductase
MNKKPLPLILGGHSFISQLGKDPALNPDQQQELVAACLDVGITWFDTTYQPERKALGNALAVLKRREEATIIAWNFFTDFDARGDLGGAAPYEPHHIKLIQDQLQTELIDCLVVHGVPDPAAHQKQVDLALSCQQQGLVHTLGLWNPGPDADKKFPALNPYSFMVQPYNVVTENAPASFTAAKKLGWNTYACSPFVRG